MNFLSSFVGTAHAQFGSGGSGSTQNSFSLSSFTFLRPLSTPANPDSLISSIIGIILTIAALAAFIYLIIAGFQYITAGGDADKATKARTGIINALIGIIVIVLAYVILRFVANNLIPGTTAP